MTDLFKNAIFSRTILIVLLLFNSPVVYSANPIIQNMIATFEANEAKFYQQYRGRKIEGEGTVTAIESVLYERAIGFSILLNTDGSSVRCLTQNQNMAARLNKGQKINFIGIVDDVLINQLSIQNCVVSDVLNNTNSNSSKPSSSYKIPSWQLDFENSFKNQSEKAIEVINSRTNKDTKREDFNKSQVFSKIKDEILLKTKNYINESKELTCKIISFNSFKIGDIKCRSLITNIDYELKISNFDKEIKVSENLLFEDDIININVELYDFSLNAHYPNNQIRLKIKGESSNKITLLNDNNKKIVIPFRLASDTEVNKGIIEEFQAKIASKIRSNINKTLCERSDAEVTFEIKLMPTGEFSEGPILISSNANGNCNNAVERAIRMSEPLPLPLDKSLFKNFEKLRLKLQPNQ